MKLKMLFAAAVLVAAPACSEQTPETISETTDAPIRWKMTSVFPSSLTILGTIGKRFEQQVALISGGNLEFKYYEPGATGPSIGGL